MPKGAGVYVRGSIGGIPVWFTIDTGATRTIVSNRIFKKLKEHKQSLVEPSQDNLMSQAGGDPLVECGRAKLTLDFGPQTITREVIIAEIQDDVLIGMDIGENMDVLSTQNKLILDGQEIPCTFVKSNTSRRVFVAVDYEIPALSEAIIEAHIEQIEVNDNGEFLIEPLPELAESTDLCMASSIVHLSQEPIAQVRLINPTEDSIILHRLTNIGMAEIFDPAFSVVISNGHRLDGNTCDVHATYVKSSDNEPADHHSNTCHSVSQIRQVQKADFLLDENSTTSSPQDHINPGLMNSMPQHLKDIFKQAVCGRSEEEQTAVHNLLIKFQNSFSKDDMDLGITTLTQHIIETGSTRPIKQAPRRVPLALVDEEKQAIEKMLQQGIIHESMSPWASPIVLVKKKSGAIRPCVDYRKVNATTTKDAYPIPRTQDCLDCLSGASVFSTLDMTSGYNQIPVRPEDQPKTAFVTRYGLFEYKTMPFGLTNAPATFQRLMELALRGLQWTSCLIYLDDVIIFGSSVTQHLQRLECVLSRISEANLKLKPSKCQLLQSEVPFLGHIISSKGVVPNPENTDKVKDWKDPSTVTQVRQFLGFCSYYRRHVRNFSTIAKPLTELTKLDSPLKWTLQCQEAFSKLKTILTSPELMAYPQDKAGFILDTDACDYGIGAVLSQLQDGKERVIAYASRTLNKAEQNYCVTDKELLAVKHFIEYFRQYLLGRTFLVRSDHQALKWLFTLREPKGRIARWIEILSAFDFEIEYRPGVRHQNADGMSRCLNPRECDCPSDGISTLPCGPCTKCSKKSEEMQSQCLGTTRINRIINSDQHLPQNHKRPSNSGRSVLHLIRLMLCNLLLILAILCQSAETTMDISNFFSTKCGITAEQVRNVSNDNMLDTPPKSMLDGKFSWFKGYTDREIRQMQLADEAIGKVLEWKGTDKRPRGVVVCSSCPKTRHYWNYWDSLEVRRGVLFKQNHQPDNNTQLQLIVPAIMRHKIMANMHDSLLSGHLGKKKTVHKTLDTFYWYGLRKDIDLWIRQCDVCAANKPAVQRPKATLGDMRVGAPWDRLSMDILGPLPLTKRGNRFVFVVCDAFTKWTEIFAIPDQTAPTCASILLNEVIGRYGCPYDLHSDQGRNFESDIIRDLCKLLNIRKTRTSARRPQCNGQVERYNRTLIKMIRAYLKGEQNNWDVNLGCLAAAYRASVCESTGFTPNMLLLGREARKPYDVGLSGQSHLEGHIYVNYVQELIGKLQKAHTLARTNLERSNRRQKDFYDGKSVLHKYHSGDLVWYRNENRKIGITPKLQPHYSGPYLVLKRHNDLNYCIQLDRAGEKKVVHHDKLKKYEGTLELKWARSALRKFGGQRSTNVSDSNTTCMK